MSLRRSCKGPPLTDLTFGSYLIPREITCGAFPRAKKMEIAKFLLQFHRLIDDALGFLAITHLDKAGEREILAQGMALNAVIGEDAAQVGMTGEQDAVEVESLALIPVRRGEHPDRRGHRRV